MNIATSFVSEETSVDCPIHPVANIFPLMNDAELMALATDIQAHGLREPIERLNGEIIDGRNRYYACQRADIEPRYHDLQVEPHDLVSYVLSHNLHRRHLTTAQRAMAAARAREVYAANAKDRQREHGGTAPGRPQNTCGTITTSVSRRTRDEVGEDFHVSGKYVDLAAKVQDTGIKELQEAVERGDIPLPKAAKLAETSEAEQRQSLLKGASKKGRSGTGSYRTLSNVLHRHSLDLRRLTQRAAERLSIADSAELQRCREQAAALRDLLDAIDVVIAAAQDRQPEVGMEEPHDGVDTAPALGSERADATTNRDGWNYPIEWREGGSHIVMPDGTARGPYRSKHHAREQLKEYRQGIRSDAELHP